MPQRSGMGLEEVAEIGVLAAAFWRAARGRNGQPEVQRMMVGLEKNLSCLAMDILLKSAPGGNWSQFTIYDPKERLILAPCFRDRVVHHAMMGKLGPILEQSLVDDTYACRPGRGTLAAVLRAQQQLRRYPWYVKADIRSYFASVDHKILIGCLERRFKHPDLLDLCRRVLSVAPGKSGVGLPIGALTSQHFANLYPDGADRFLLERIRVRGMVRYMDDIVWWCDSYEEAKRSLLAFRKQVWESRRLVVKDSVVIGRSVVGLSFLGFRVYPWALRLLLRRKRRYAAARLRWERKFLGGQISAVELQAKMDGVMAITAHADARRWRLGQMERRPPVDA